ncbi:AbfB-domain-containing protein [Exidia glandulosa HHB12029]|uniref:non-reducing end alpha-L-arabinofuranosidase n=1 Tax=Exidia glandulosa HHB12029 TaxID=1314781 RepID=A0A165PW62_EXIGL|nr:AbfB-domain-containing protein [Exidia glandulosa HHB12029]
MRFATAVFALSWALSALAQTYSGYAVVYFTESPSGTANDYNLHLGVSSDGLEWMPLNQGNSVATPTSGSKGLRDPFVLRKQSGGFVVLATDLNGQDWNYQSQYLHAWDSTDLRSFTNYRLIKVHSLATHAWAPEAFYDASRGQYAIVFSAVNDSGHNVLMVSYTTDFKTATEAVVFFNPGYDAIDGSFISASGVNYLYYKAQTNSTLMGAKSSSLGANTFSIYTGSITPGRGVEAAELVKSNTANTWYLWGDTWSPNGRFFAWSTSSLSSPSWTALNDRVYTQPLNSKHAGYVPITAAELSAMKSQWGTPSWNRIKSYNYPARYWRHSNFTGRIDEYPFDPFQDQQWTVVAGLANSSAVSFRSVNYPTYYLRHSNFTLLLQANDGSSTYNADATFSKVAGLADSAYTSFQSFNYPTRYIRHSNFSLRIDEIASSSSATDKQDATFKAVACPMLDTPHSPYDGTWFGSLLYMISPMPFLLNLRFVVLPMLLQVKCARATLVESAMFSYELKVSLRGLKRHVENLNRLSNIPEWGSPNLNLEQHPVTYEVEHGAT